MKQKIHNFFGLLLNAHDAAIKQEDFIKSA